MYIVWLRNINPQYFRAPALNPQIIGALWLARPSQVLPKLLPFDVILRDRELSDLFVQDSFERQSAHGNMRALAAALELLVGRGIEASRLPPSVVVRPLNSEEVRVKLSGAEIVLVSQRTNAVCPVFPKGFSCEDILTVTHMVDRGSVGSAFLRFALSQDYVWGVHFGYFHDLWNSIR